MFVFWDVKNRQTEIVPLSPGPLVHRPKMSIQREEIPAKLPFYGLPWSLPALHLGALQLLPALSPLGNHLVTPNKVFIDVPGRPQHGA